MCFNRVHVIYIIITDKVGDTCSINEDCTSVIPHSNCSQGVCVCNSGYYHSNDYSTCVRSKSYSILLIYVFICHNVNAIISIEL